MKNLVLFLALLSFSNINAQVAVDKETFRSKGSLLEFKDMAEGGAALGIILPILKDASKVAEGALWVDATTQKVMYKTQKKSIALTNINTSINMPEEETNKTKVAGVIISDNSVSTNDPAILKLDSNKAALLLPHVNDVTRDIVNPEVGTIAYDVKSKSLAIFNGSEWSFWN